MLLRDGAAGAHMYRAGRCRSLTGHQANGNGRVTPVVVIVEPIIDQLDNSSTTEPCDPTPFGNTSETLPS